MDFLGLGGSSKPVSDELKSGEIFPGVVPGTTFKGPGENPLRHTVLGAGSVLAKAFRKALAERNPSYKCRLVKGGNIPPKPLFESDETFACDFDQANAIDYVVQGSTIVYVMHEFVLDYHTWQSKWPGESTSLPLTTTTPILPCITPHLLPLPLSTSYTRPCSVHATCIG